MPRAIACWRWAANTRNTLRTIRAETTLENNKMSTHLSTEQLLHAYRVMRTIRAFEERLHVEFATGEIPGFVHLYAGEEASAAGVMAHLRDSDCIASNHRGHGHCIAKGVDVVAMMKEIYGKKGGCGNGKGGSMHIADLSKGMMGANGILGAGAPLICGAALAAKFRGDGGVGIFQGGGGNPRHQLASHRVAALEGSTVSGGARLAANQQGHVQHGDSSLLSLSGIRSSRVQRRGQAAAPFSVYTPAGQA